MQMIDPREAQSQGRLPGYKEAAFQSQSCSVLSGLRVRWVISALPFLLVTTGQGKMKSTSSIVQLTLPTATPQKDRIVTWSHSSQTTPVRAIHLAWVWRKTSPLQKTLWPFRRASPRIPYSRSMWEGANDLAVTDYTPPPSLMVSAANSYNLNSRHLPLSVLTCSSLAWGATSSHLNYLLQ